MPDDLKISIEDITGGFIDAIIEFNKFQAGEVEFGWGVASARALFFEMGLTDPQTFPAPAELAALKLISIPNDNPQARTGPKWTKMVTESHGNIENVMTDANNYLARAFSAEIDDSIPSVLKPNDYLESSLPDFAKKRFTDADRINPPNFETGTPGSPYEAPADPWSRDAIYDDADSAFRVYKSADAEALGLDASFVEGPSEGEFGGPLEGPGLELGGRSSRLGERSSRLGERSAGVSETNFSADSEFLTELRELRNAIIGLTQEMARQTEAFSSAEKTAKEKKHSTVYRER